MKKLLWLIICLMAMVTSCAPEWDDECIYILEDGTECGKPTSTYSLYCSVHYNERFERTIDDNRCIATTEKGTRCKRKAEKGSRYCWQHR